MKTLIAEQRQSAVYHACRCGTAMSDPTDLPDSTPPDAEPATPPEATSAPDVEAGPATVVTAAADAPADVAAPTPDGTTAPGDSAVAPNAGRTDPRAAVPAPAATLALLRTHFPALFAGPAKPLKLRVQQDIQERAPGVFTKAALSAFFRRHTTSTAYLIAMSKATHRIDLDGQPAGELSEEHKQAAVAELTRRRQITREREQAAQAQQRAQQREAQRAEMAAQAEANQARQARAQLLRDFQRTTLTLANFCVLKGMTPEALQPLLDQAKREAAEAPPPMQRPADDRRGPRPDHRGSRGGDGSRPDRRDDRQNDPRAARPGGRPGQDDRRPARPDGDRRPARPQGDRRPGQPADGQRAPRAADGSRPGRTSDDRPSTRKPPSGGGSGGPGGQS